MKSEMIFSSIFAVFMLLSTVSSLVINHIPRRLVENYEDNDEDSANIAGTNVEPMGTTAAIVTAPLEGTIDGTVTTTMAAVPTRAATNNLSNIAKVLTILQSDPINKEMSVRFMLDMLRTQYRRAKNERQQSETNNMANRFHARKWKYG